MNIPYITPQFIISWESQIVFNIFSGKVFSPPTGVFEVLKLINGVRDTHAIYSTLTQKYHVKEEDFSNLIDKLCELGVISFDKSKKHEPQPIRVVSVEITEKCNLRCRYCYGAFNPNKQTYLSAKETEVLFNALQKRGVLIIELSGGEPTVNPDFDMILEQACQRFNVVTIMTNAVSIKDHTFEVFEKYKHKINFSISIDGFSDKTNDYQRDVPNTFNKTLNNIVRIKNELDPSMLRVVYMLTNDNEHEVDTFFDFMLNHGIKDITVSIPEHIEKGRTYSLPDGCNMSDYCSESRKTLNDKTWDLSEKYGTRINTYYDRLGDFGMQIASALPSCGAGWMMLSLKANGDVQPCNMMDSCWTIGNFKKDPSLNFLSGINSLYSLLMNINLSAENGNRDQCKECSDAMFCGKCLNKIFIANRRRLEKGLDVCPILESNGFTSSTLTSKFK